MITLREGTLLSPVPSRSCFFFRRCSDITHFYTTLSRGLRTCNNAFPVAGGVVAYNRYSNARTDFSQRRHPDPPLVPRFKMPQVEQIRIKLRPSYSGPPPCAPLVLI